MNLRQAVKITRRFDQQRRYRVSSLRSAARVCRRHGRAGLGGWRLALWCILGAPDTSEHRSGGLLVLREKWKGKV